MTMDSNRGKTVLISSTKGEQFHMNAGADLYIIVVYSFIHNQRGRPSGVRHFK